MREGPSTVTEYVSNTGFSLSSVDKADLTFPKSEQQHAAASDSSHRQASQRNLFDHPSL